MNGYATVLRKELHEGIRTWRIWVLLGAFTLFGLVDPVITKNMPAILGSVMGDQFPIELPETTYLDAWAQWAGDLAQLLTIVVIVVAAASVAGEVSAGTLVMPLTKPVGRVALILAKFTAVTLLTLVSATAGTALTNGVTAVLFDGVDPVPLWSAVGVWLVLTVLLIAVTLIGSCLVTNTMAAFAIGFGGYIVLNLAGMWQPARAYSPAGLNDAVAGLAAGGDPSLAWPVVTALVVTVAAIALGAWSFNRRELA